MPEILRTPIARLINPRVLVDAMSGPSIMDAPHDRTSLVLSGGGSRGDFEVGALQFLYAETFRDIAPELLASTSVGSVNGVFVAEGETDSVDQLTAIWNQHDLKMYDALHPEQALADALKPTVDLAELIGGLSVGLGPLGVLISAAIVAGTKPDVSGALWKALQQMTGLYSLEPIAARARAREHGWSANGPGVRGPGYSLTRLVDGRIVILARGLDRTVHARVLPATGEPTAGWQRLGAHAESDPAVFLDAAGNPYAIMRHATDELFMHALSIDAGGKVTMGAQQDLGASGAVNSWRGGIGVAWDAHQNQARVVAANANDQVCERFWMQGIWTPWRYVATQAGNEPCGALALAFAGNGLGALVTRRADGSLAAAGKVPSRDFALTWTTVPAPPASSHPTLVGTADAVHLVYRGADLGGYHVAGRLDGAGVLAWDPPQPLGGILTSEIGAQVLPGGAIYAFGRGTDGQIWATLSGPNGDFAHGATGWQPLGASDARGFVGTPTAIAAPDGRLQLFATDVDHALWHRERAANGAWTNWVSLGGRVLTGARMRMAMTSLENGNVRYMDESGRVLGTSELVIRARTDGMIASSSIPVVNPPVTLGSETYVDGGVGSVTPISAVLAESDKVIAVVASPSGTESVDDVVFTKYPDLKAVLEGVLALNPGVQELLSQKLIASMFGDAQGIVAPSHAAAMTINFASANMLDVGFRTVFSLFPRTVTELELNPPNGFGKSVSIIRPTMPIHASDDLDWHPRRVSMTYGLMRAQDVMASRNTAGAMVTSDRITVLRLWMGRLESQLDALTGLFGPIGAAANTATVQALIAAIRKVKTMIAATIRARADAGDLIPTDAATWFQGWENVSDTVAAMWPSPWQEIKVGATVLAPAAAPPQ